MTARFVIISSMLCGLAMSDVRSGKVMAEWIGESASCEPGNPLQTAIRMIHEPGWHSYWINPGEAGIKTTVKWKLPPGWVTGTVGFPVPGRFMTSDLAGFGYEGTVLLPVTVTPPADFTGKARLIAVVSWLACGEQGCVPGEGEIHLDLSAAAPKPTTESPEIHAARQKLPKPAANAPQLAVTEKENSLVLSIKLEPDAAFDFNGCEIFPATPDVIDPRAPIRFVKNGEAWTAMVPKSEYASGPVKLLTLVIAQAGANESLELTWTAP